MADAADLKSASLTGVWVQVPPSALTPSPNSGEFDIGLFSNMLDEAQVHLGA